MLLSNLTLTNLSYKIAHLLIIWVIVLNFNTSITYCQALYNYFVNTTSIMCNYAIILPCFYNKQQGKYYSYSAPGSTRYLTLVKLLLVLTFGCRYYCKLGFWQNKPKSTAFSFLRGEYYCATLGNNNLFRHK